MMTVEECLEKAKAFYDNIKLQKKRIDSGSTTQITNQEEKEEINQIVSCWFSTFSKTLGSFGIHTDILEKYNTAFKSILRLSSGNNRRSSYQRQFRIVSNSFNEEIIIFLQTDAILPEDTDNKVFDAGVMKLLDKIADAQENEYLREAIGCWEHGFLKAAVVLAWCAAVDRMHRKIEQIGFDKFNATSAKMKAENSGRFKRFSKEYSIQSVSELRTVFDSDLLWVLEGMQLIDINEKTRLTSCFDMRCHSGHPGDAPITKYNVLSCFSDIIEIVIANPKFEIAGKP